LSTFEYDMLMALISLDYIRICTARITFFWININQRMIAKKVAPFFCVLSVLTAFACVKKIDFNFKPQVVPSGQLSSVPVAENNFKVIGYVPEWSLGSTSIQFDKVTHLNYAFLLPTKEGNLNPIEDVYLLKDLVTKAHQNKVKVLISIGGWNHGDDSAFKSISKNTDYTKNFAKQIINLVDIYDLDGVDIDWETPKFGENDKNFINLMKTLSQSIHDKKKLITIAIPSMDADGILSEVFQYIDWANVMAYDSFYDLSNHSSYALAIASLNYWKQKGLSREKTVLGVPFYGRARKEYDWLSYILYRDLVGQGANPNLDNTNGTMYNGIATIKMKTNLALKTVSGIMAWELSGDTNDKNSLLNAINEEKLNFR